MTARGSLTVVGTGIRFVSQITMEARQAIHEADCVLYGVDGPTAEWIHKMNAASESLFSFYKEDEPRAPAYQKMVARILELLRSGKKICVVFYGHPGVLVTPAHEAIRQARSEGFQAVMLPGISTLDCLYADLGVDPRFGCQTFEASDFLIYNRDFDITSPLILWQVDSIGNQDYREAAVGPNPGMIVLAEVLIQFYGNSHHVILYYAPQIPLAEPKIHRLTLEELHGFPVGSATILYIPPKDNAVLDENMMEKLGLSRLD